MKSDFEMCCLILSTARKVGIQRTQACQKCGTEMVKMIRSVLAIPAALLDQLDAPTITAYDRNIMNNMLEILEPFEEATDFGQRDMTVTASYIIPTIIGLPIHLATMESPITVV